MQRSKFINASICKRLLTSTRQKHGTVSTDTITTTTTTTTNTPSPTKQYKDNAERLLHLFRDTRSKTQSLVSTLEPDDFVVQTAHYTSPPKWHIGHVSWIYEAIMGKIDSKYGFEKGEISKYLNSYYRQFGTPHDKASRGIISRPTTKKMFEYFEKTSAKVERFMAEYADDINAHGTAYKNHNDPKDTARLLEMGIHHECQHQELLVYDLQHILADRYHPAQEMLCKPRAVYEKADHTQRHHNDNNDKKQVKVEGGIYMLGHNGGQYCYDIELPEHKIYMNSYNIDIYPITNGQYMEFIEDDGYNTYRHWLSDGWEKVNENNWESPMYWEQDKKSKAWKTRDFAGLRDVNPYEPVCHISYYEAAAYCKWAKKRLPTEAEWEKAACWDYNKQQKRVYPWGDDAPTSDKCNLLESGRWMCSEIGRYPQGVSAYGCHQMIGDVWEWTSSEFSGYPGFESGFDEYNDKWFANQKVLRGGSFGTPCISIRGSYRIFFRPDERWMISGFRCAQDAASSNADTDVVKFEQTI